MIEKEALHWSFQYDGRSQIPYFTPHLVNILEQAALEDGPGEQEVVERYVVLPNYWRGYKRERGETPDGYDLRIGEAVIDRRWEASGCWRYAVRFLNTTSGEDLKLDFQCLDDDFRTLVGDWNVTADNGAGHGYQRFVGAGQLVPQGDRLQVMLTVNDVVLPVGDVEGSDPVTCNWALFDVIPTLADELRSTGEQASLTVLEDLEKIRPDSRIGFLEDWTLPLDGGALELSGFFVYGEGALPSYWWLDREGRVIVVSTIFQTLVLTSRTLGDVA